MRASDDIGRFFRQVGVVAAVAGVLTAYPVYATWGLEAFLAATVGFGISTLNVLIGGASALWALDKPQPVFLKTILGGMAARMIAICVIFIVLVRMTDFSVLALGSSLFAFYLIYQVLEIRFLTRRAAGARGEGE